MRDIIITCIEVWIRKKGCLGLVCVVLQDFFGAMPLRLIIDECVHSPVRSKDLETEPLPF